MQQRLFGIGVLLRDDVDGFSVLKLVEGGPAARQAILELGDKIIAVNDEPVIGLDLMDVVEMVRGEPGSSVRLKILRRTEDDQGNETVKSFEAKVKRGEVVVKDLRYGCSTQDFKDGVLGYLRLHSFYQDNETSSYADLLSTLETLQNDHHVNGVILDLRCNPGGFLTQAVAVTGLFVDKGIVVSIKDELGSIAHMRNIGLKKIWKGPLIVLINRASASSSEIVAQTLQDWGRAIIVGDDRSFGKGSFQTFTLNVDGRTPPNSQGEYKVTRGRYYTVSGKSPQLVGVHSDIVVPGLLCFAEVGEQYTRFPLCEDAIRPNFEDTFDDVPFFQKPLLKRLYDFSHQTRTDTWTQFLPQLKKRAEERLAQNETYQQFLVRAKKQAETGAVSTEETQKETDFQLEEAWNIMQDLVTLSKENSETPDQRQAA